MSENISTKGKFYSLGCKAGANEAVIKQIAWFSKKNWINSEKILKFTQLIVGSAIPKEDQGSYLDGFDLAETYDLGFKKGQELATLSALMKTARKSPYFSEGMDRACRL